MSESENSEDTKTETLDYLGIFCIEFKTVFHTFESKTKILSFMNTRVLGLQANVSINAN